MANWRRGERYDVAATGPAPTMAGLHPAQRVEITCTNVYCRHRVLWTSAEAVARFGPACTFRTAPERLKCTVCGAGRFDHRPDVRPYSIDTDDIRHGLHGRAS